MTALAATYRIFLHQISPNSTVPACQVTSHLELCLRGKLANRLPSDAGIYQQKKPKVSDGICGHLNRA